MKDALRSGNRTHDHFVLILSWLTLSLILMSLALPNLHAPGLYYDEAVSAGMAKDFVNGTHNIHMPGTQVVNVLGRPFPLFIQSYYGALKSWLIIPSLMFFDPTLPILRLTALFWCLIGLLLFMLWTRELLGLSAALIAAPILALDPSFFFLSVIDWGPITPGFLCRLGGFYLIILWWKDIQTHYGIAAAFMLGLGFFSKIDFLVVLLGCGIAVVAVYGKEILTSVRNFPGKIMLFFLGLFLGASPMALNIWIILQSVLTGQPSQKIHEMLEKFNTFLAMYNGSYMHRLMNAGGRFDTMYAQPTTVWSPFGLVVILSGIFLLINIVRRKGELLEKRKTAFILISTFLITAGVFMLPEAVRMHHATIVYPFPHLIVTAAIILLWRAAPAPSIATTWCIRSCAVGIAVIVVVGHLLAILKTQELLESTGGRGYWSDSIGTFSNEASEHHDQMVVSADWGFNEQLIFLGHGVKLSEPLWNSKPIQISPNSVYLVHPPEYSLFPEGLAFFRMASQQAPENITIQPYRDRQGNVAFYAIRFLGGKAGL